MEPKDTFMKDGAYRRRKVALIALILLMVPMASVFYLFPSLRPWTLGIAIAGIPTVWIVVHLLESRVRV